MKIRMNSVTYTLVIALFFTLFQNIALWERVATIFAAMPDASWGLRMTIPIVVLAIMNALFTLLTWPYIHRIVISLIIVISAAATYAMHQYGIVLSYGMIVSVIDTDTNEATSYLSMSALTWYLALAIVPLLLLSRVNVEFRHLGKELLFKLASIMVSILVVGCIASFYFKDYASLLRNNSELGSALNPTNYITATARVVNKRWYEANLPYVQIGTDAVNRNQGNPRKNLLVVVIGETARAENSSFNGYEKETNAFLAQQEGVINYPNVTSCGTCTAVSVPCMFSNMPKSSYNASKARRQDSVVDILNHAGVDVLWKNNNSGCKGACDRIRYIDGNEEKRGQYCQWGSCYDGILLEGLDEHINSLETDGVIVLHLLGSHGPTYYKRYPQEFRKFTPTCDTADIQNCSREELMNTYDNSLLYTDYLLSQLIDTLRSHDDKFNTAMLYVSDHGESLGENGVYLHGMPASIAPNHQTHVPMITWMSDKFTAKHQLDNQCMQKVSNERLSHDNFFHSVLGLMDIDTSEYQPKLDIFAACTIKASEEEQ